MNDFLATTAPENAQPQVPGGLADGFYFDLPEKDYHADPALGSSGICDLLVSPVQFWRNSPFNAKREASEDSEAQLFGSYFHDLIAGRAGTYAIKPDDMSFSTKYGKAWRAAHADKTIIKHEQTVTARAMYDALLHAGVIEKFMGGIPEVSYFWTRADGIRCKIRADIFRHDLAGDWKTYANTMNKDTETLIAHTVAAHRYHVKAVWYQSGIDHMRKAVRAGVLAKHGTAKPFDWQAFAESDETAFPLYYVFIEKHEFPEITVRRFKPHSTEGLNAYWRAGRNEIDRALQSYRRFASTAGFETPWRNEVPFKAFADEEFTAARWILEQE